MTTQPPKPAPRLGTARALLYGTLLVGSLDILDAIVFFAFRGVPPIRIFQSVAGGILGREAFRGGIPTALLGAGLHYFISFSIVAVYLAASRKLPILTRHAVTCGLLYGLVVYGVMNRIVVPLSAASPPRFSIALLLNGLLAHTLLVGLPSAVVARAAAMSSGPRKPPVR